VAREYKGSYRSIYTRLYDDAGFQRLQPRERDVLKTLRTCPAVNLPVLYRFTWEELALWTGYTQVALKRSVATLERAGWVVCRYPVVWVRNGLKFDPTFATNNKDQVTALYKALLDVPHSEVVGMFLKHYSLPRGPLTPPSPPSDLPPDSKDSESEKESEKEKRLSVKPAGLDGARESFQDDFGEWWSAYPRKVEKKVALGKYQAQRRKGVTALTLLTAAKNYAAQCRAKDTELRFIKHPTTFLNQDRWEDHLTSEEAESNARVDRILSSFNPS